MCTWEIILLWHFLVKDEQIDVSGLYFMMIKFSSNLYQYQGAKGANRLWKDPLWVDEEIQETGSIVEIGGGKFSRNGGLPPSALYGWI